MRVRIEKVAARETLGIWLLAFENLGDARPVKAEGRYPPETEAFSFP